MHESCRIVNSKVDEVEHVLAEVGLYEEGANQATICERYTSMDVDLRSLKTSSLNQLQVDAMLLVPPLLAADKASARLATPA